MAHSSKRSEPKNHSRNKRGTGFTASTATERRVPPAVPIGENDSTIRATIFVGKTWEERWQFLIHARDILQRDDPLRAGIDEILKPAKWRRVLEGRDDALAAEVEEITAAAWKAEEARKGAVRRKWVRATEEYRREVKQRMERHLREATIAWEKLRALKWLFEEEYKNNPELFAQVLIDGTSLVCGPGGLKFRQLATRVAGHWKSWLYVVVGYLIEEDHNHEYIEILSAETASGMPKGAEPKKGESYTVHRLLMASALCCSWLLRRKELKEAALHSGRPGGKQLEARRGYRTEVREWMHKKGIRTNSQAARLLGVSVSSLKSVMSAMGVKRYSDENLRRILDQIDLK